MSRSIRSRIGKEKTMQKKASLLSLAALAVPAFGLFVGTVPAQADVPAVASFDYSLSIASDGMGPYVNGQQGVVCHFFDASSGGTGDFVLLTNGNGPSGGSKQTPRMLNYQFTSPASVACTPAAGGTLPFSGLQIGDLSIHGLIGPIYNMPAGQTQPAVAQSALSGGENGRLRFGDLNPGANPCGTPVSVTLSADGSTWTIATTPPAATAGPSTNGEIASLFQSVKGHNVATSFWNMPFQVTVRRLQ
jgi:hypothetical protein